MTAQHRDADATRRPEEPERSPDEPGGTLPDGWRPGASAAGGLTLVALGLRRRGIAGWTAVLGGGVLLYRGLRRLRSSGGDSGGGAAGDQTDRTESVGKAHGHAPEALPEATTTSKSITVGAPPEEVYERWRDPETLEQVFGAFGEVTVSNADRLHWEVDGPLGRTVAWDTRVVEEQPGEFLRWESSQSTVIPSEGSIRFRRAPGDRGTEVTMRIQVDPPGGSVGSAVAERLGFVPAVVAEKALRRFKSLVETGETPTLDGNPSGRGEGDLL